jgi:hypothetical protein
LPGGDQPPVPRWIKACIIGGLAALVAFVIWRTTLWPLSGWDNPFRWNFLAQRILQQQGFGFYPPVTADDYRLYFYTDGIPPLVSFAYWWLYAAVGGYHPALTSMLIAAQLACTLGFTYRIGRALGSPLAGLFSAAILGGSTLWVHAIAIGQETGFTALAIAAIVCAVVEGVRSTGDGPAWQAFVLAGLAAALGAMAREYGCAFPILGAIAVFWIGGRPKYAAILCATAAFVASPWYLRNLLRAGNPFFSNHFGSFYVNPIHAQMLDYYRMRMGVTTWSPDQWVDIFHELLLQAPLQITLGVLGLVIFFRRCGFLAVIAGAIGLLWAYSIGETSGGWLYSLRLLSPVFVVLSITAGIFLARWSSRPPLREISMAVMGILLLWSIAAATVHPLDQSLARFEHWTNHFLLRPPDREEWWDELVGKLPAGSRVLTENSYIYSDLQRRGLSPPGLTEAEPGAAKPASGLEVVPIWSPQVAFVFDDTLSPEEIRQRLLDHGIRYLIIQNNFNGQFLSNHIRFYREGSPTWVLLYGIPRDYYVFDLSGSIHKPANGTGGG